MLMISCYVFNQPFRLAVRGVNSAGLHLAQPPPLPPLTSADLHPTLTSYSALLLTRADLLLGPAPHPR
eukprot:334001-Chlamydomonas_euryale.AAC.1